MTTKRFLFLLVLCSLAGLLFAQAGPGLRTKIWPLLQVRSTSVVMPNVTLVLEEILTGTQHPQPFVSDRQTITFRSDGSKSTEHNYLQNGSFWYAKRELALASGVMGTVFPSEKIASLLTLPKHPWVNQSIWPDPSKNCAFRRDGRSQGQILEQSSLMGYRIFKFVSESQSARITKWAAPDLGCEIIHRIAEFRKPNGEFSDSSELILRSVSSSVDDARFKVPSDYELMPLGELHRRFWASHGRQMTADDLVPWAEVDKAYATRKADIRESRP